MSEPTKEPRTHADGSPQPPSAPQQQQQQQQQQQDMNKVASTATNNSTPPNSGSAKTGNAAPSQSPKTSKPKRGSNASAKKSSGSTNSTEPTEISQSGAATGGAIGLGVVAGPTDKSDQQTPPSSTYSGRKRGPGKFNSDRPGNSSRGGGDEENSRGSRSDRKANRGQGQAPENTSTSESATVEVPGNVTKAESGAKEASDATDATTANSRPGQQLESSGVSGVKKAQNATRSPRSPRSPRRGFGERGAESKSNETTSQPTPSSPRLDRGFNAAETNDTKKERRDLGGPAANISAASTESAKKLKLLRRKKKNDDDDDDASTVSMSSGKEVEVPTEGKEPRKSSGLQRRNGPLSQEGEDRMVSNQAKRSAVHSKDIAGQTEEGSSPSGWASKGKNIRKFQQPYQQQQNQYQQWSKKNDESFSPKGPYHSKRSNPDEHRTQDKDGGALFSKPEDVAGKDLGTASTEPTTENVPIKDGWGDPPAKTTGDGWGDPPTKTTGDGWGEPPAKTTGDRWGEPPANPKNGRGNSFAAGRSDSRGERPRAEHNDSWRNADTKGAKGQRDGKRGPPAKGAREQKEDAGYQAEKASKAGKAQSGGWVEASTTPESTAGGEAPAKDESTGWGDPPAKTEGSGWGDPPAKTEGSGWGDPPVNLENGWGGSSATTKSTSWGDPPTKGRSDGWGNSQSGWNRDNNTDNWGNGQQRFSQSGRGGFGNNRGRPMSGNDSRFANSQQGQQRGGRRFQDSESDLPNDARSSLGARNTRLGFQRGPPPGGVDGRFDKKSSGNAPMENRGGAKFGSMSRQQDTSSDSRHSMTTSSSVGPGQSDPRSNQRGGSFSNQHGQSNHPSGSVSADSQRRGKDRVGQPEQTRKGLRVREPRESKAATPRHTPLFSNSLECRMTWDEMGLLSNVRARIAEAGLDIPSNIQKLMIMPFIEGKDVIAQSQSQNDRTITLAIALLQKLSTSASAQKHCQALVICSEGINPQKVHEDFQSWFEAAPGLKSILLTTDADASRAVLSDPDQAKQVVLTTLGPLMEALRNDLLDMKTIETVVISMRLAELVNFEAFKQFWALLSRDAQVVLMTGRIQPPIEVLKAQNFRADAAVRRADELTMQWSEHYFVAIPSPDKDQQANDDQNQDHDHESDSSPKDHKWEVLMDILTKNPDISHTVILTQSQSLTQALTAKLEAQKLPVLSVWSMADKTEVARQFNAPEPCILVSESILMDNLDLDFSSLVINYEMPKRVAHYISSFGPFGRSGLRTLMINFCVRDDPAQKQILEDMESLYDIKIREMELD